MFSPPQTFIIHHDSLICSSVRWYAQKLPGKVSAPTKPDTSTQPSAWCHCPLVGKKPATTYSNQSNIKKRYSIKNMHIFLHRWQTVQWMWGRLDGHCLWLLKRIHYLAKQQAVAQVRKTRMGSQGEKKRWWDKERAENERQDHGK